jgi:hypothetical protein
MKYWLVSYKTARGKRVIFTHYFGLLLNFALPLFLAVAGGRDLKENPLAFHTVIWIQVLSCRCWSMLAEGCSSRKETISDVNTGFLTPYVAVYLLYLAGLFNYWYTATSQETTP